MINDRIPDQRKEGFEMLERRELKGLDTTYLSMKVPVALYEIFRAEAYHTKQTVSRVVEQALREYVQKKEGQKNNERHATSNNG